MQILPIIPASEHQEVALQPIAPGQRRLWRVTAAIKSLLVVAAVSWLETAVSAYSVLAAKFEAENPDTNLPDLWLPFGALLGLAVLWRAYAVFYRPNRMYRSWAYALTDGELHVRRGIWTVSHTIVPLTSVQHVDTSQGPLERRFGLSRLIVHTAAAGTAHVQLIGLPTAVAVELRDAIRATAAARAPR